MYNPARPPALVVQRAMVKHKVIAPLHGGIDNFTASDIAWTGGNPYDSTINDPAVNGCYHPIEPDKIRKAEHKCVQPLAKARRLKTRAAKVGQMIYH